MILSNKNIAVVAFLILGIINIYAQKSDSILQQNIEVVRILKNNTSKKSLQATLISWIMTPETFSLIFRKSADGELPEAMQQILF